MVRMRCDLKNLKYGEEEEISTALFERAGKRFYMGAELASG